MATQHFKWNLLLNLYREGKKISPVCFLLPLRELKMSGTCSPFPPLGDLWPSCLLPSHYFWLVFPFMIKALTSIDRQQKVLNTFCCCCPVTQSCPTLCDPMDCRQASLSITNSWSLLKLMSIESVMPSSHLIPCRPLLLLSSIFPIIRVFYNELTLHICWPNYWSFSFSTFACSQLLPFNHISSDTSVWVSLNLMSACFREIGGDSQ